MSSSKGTDLELQGWLEKDGGGIFRTRNKRYFRLRASVLSQFADPETSTEKNSLDLWGARIDCNPKAREIVIVPIGADRRSGSITLYANTDDEFRAWSVALMRATGSYIEKFYEVGRQIGSGAYGKVYEGQSRLTGQKVAIKAIEKNRASPKELRYIQRESAILTRVNHPNVVTTYDVFEKGELYMFVMEFLPGGELFDMIAESTHFSEAQAADVMRQLMSGISYLHENGIVHRDIKPENILCVSKAWPLHIKLTDFGLSNVLDPNQTSGSALVSYVGTQNYYAPEVFLHQKYGCPVDVFSAGVVLYIMLSGKFPFWGKSEDEYWERLKRGVRFPPKQWERVSAEAKDLLLSMLALEPERRPLASQVTQHPWFGSNSSHSAALNADGLRSLHSSKRSQFMSIDNMQ